MASRYSFVVSLIGKCIKLKVDQGTEFLHITVVVESTLKIFPAQGHFQLLGPDITTIAFNYLGRTLRCYFCFSYKHLPTQCDRPKTNHAAKDSTAGVNSKGKGPTLNSSRHTEGYTRPTATTSTGTLGTTKGPAKGNLVHEVVQKWVAKPTAKSVEGTARGKESLRAEELNHIQTSTLTRQELPVDLVNAVTQNLHLSPSSSLTPVSPAILPYPTETVPGSSRKRLRFELPTTPFNLNLSGEPQADSPRPAKRAFRPFGPAVVETGSGPLIPVSGMINTSQDSIHTYQHVGSTQSPTHWGQAPLTFHHKDINFSHLQRAWVGLTTTLGEGSASAGELADTT